MRIEAAAALASLGSFGTSCALQEIHKSQDPYVRANLALALLGQREECPLACQILDEFLHGRKELLMICEEKGFPILKKSTLSHQPALHNFPTVMDQAVRLQIFKSSWNLRISRSHGGD